MPLCFFSIFFMFFFLHLHSDLMLFAFFQVLFISFDSLLFTCSTFLLWFVLTWKPQDDDIFVREALRFPEGFFQRFETRFWEKLNIAIFENIFTLQIKSRALKWQEFVFCNKDIGIEVQLRVTNSIWDDLEIKMICRYCDSFNSFSFIVLSLSCWAISS